MDYKYDKEFSGIIREMMIDFESGAPADGTDEDMLVLKRGLLISLKKYKAIDGYAFIHEVHGRSSRRKPDDKG